MSVHLQSLSSQEQRRFHEGLREFSETDSAAEGLGPFFNAASCAHCHSIGGVGGSGNVRVVRAMCKSGEGAMSEPPGGSLIHLFSTRPEMASPRIPGNCQVVVTQRRTTNVLGLGLVEAIADADIVAEAESQPAALRGRVAWVEDLVSGTMRVGRFGWKNQHANLTAFSGDAYLNEMGITNEFFPDEVAPQGNEALLAAIDTTPDPEAPVGAVQRSADFMRFSEPSPTNEDEHAVGRAEFRKLGCVSCHRERYRTADTAGSLAGRDVLIYSDLLLHDIGTGNDIPQGAASRSEFRTAPLRGVSHVALLLHDGRASSLEEAIAMHAGQASASASAYETASASERADLLTFLKSL